jgi:MoxR-like ATPase
MGQKLKITEIYRKACETVVGRQIEIISILTAMEAGKHILLEGPPGTSKSTLLRIIAKVAGIPFYIIEGNVDLTPAKLVGHFNPAKVMADSYLPEYFEKGPLTSAMEKGGILYIEEFNRMPADVSNVLISPMEEGEIAIPRYGSIKSIRPFTVIAAQNPYDDVGTVRVSRAFMDRICLIKMKYQDEDEERAIVRLRTGSDNLKIIELAVKMVRETRNHPDIKLGASIRAGIDLVDLFTGMQKLSDKPEQNFLTSAWMAMSNKIWLNEMAAKSADEIIEDLWNSYRGKGKSYFENSGGQNADPGTQQEDEEKSSDEALKAKKKTDRHVANWFLSEEMEHCSYFYRVACYLNANPDELDLFFEKQDSLEVFANVIGMLKENVRAQAVKIASRVIIKIAKQIADTGCRTGRMKLKNGFSDGAEIELDCSLERYTQQPELGILDNLVSYIRQQEKRAFVMMFDHSYSMKGMKIILAAITAAAIAQHFKKDYGVLAFSNQITVLKGIDESTGPEEVLERLFALQLSGDTDIRLALETGLDHLAKFEEKRGLILTDGAWNRGGDPLEAAVRFDKLGVIGFPPAKREKIRQLAVKGEGDFSFVEDETEIACAILDCLN